MDKLMLLIIMLVTVIVTNIIVYHRHFIIQISSVEFIIHISDRTLLLFIPTKSKLTFGISPCINKLIACAEPQA